MKRMFFWAMCSALLLTLYGCPKSTKFSLGEQGEHKIDKNLLGTWQCTLSKTDSGVYKATINKKTGYLYKVTVEEWGDLWSNAKADEYTGWITKVDDMTFLCLDGTDSDELYAFCIEINGKKQFSLFDIYAEDYVTGGNESGEAYRKDIRDYFSKAKKSQTPYIYNKQ